MRSWIVVLLVSAVTYASPSTGTGTVVGIVTDDQRPVADATLRFAIEGRDPIYIQTDRDGKYRVSLAPALWHMSASRSDEVTTSGVVEIVAGHELAYDVRMTGHPRTIIHGDVTEDGRPAPGARVEAIDIGDQARVSVTLTDGNGHYELAIGSANIHRVGMERAVIAVSRAGAMPLEREGGTRDAARVDFALTTGGSIAGVVRDAAHQPIPNAAIVVTRDTARYSDQAGTGATRTIVARPDGTFEIPDLIASTYELRVGSGARRLITLGAAEHVTGVELTAAK